MNRHGRAGRTLQRHRIAVELRIGRQSRRRIADLSWQILQLLSLQLFEFPGEIFEELFDVGLQRFLGWSRTCTAGFAWTIRSPLLRLCQLLLSPRTLLTLAGISSLIGLLALILVIPLARCGTLLAGCARAALISFSAGLSVLLGRLLRGSGRRGTRFRRGLSTAIGRCVGGCLLRRTRLFLSRRCLSSALRATLTLWRTSGGRLWLALTRLSLARIHAGRLRWTLSLIRIARAGLSRLLASLSTLTRLTTAALPSRPATLLALRWLPSSRWLGLRG